MFTVNSDSSIMPFGKYTGYDLQELASVDPSYARWLLKEDWFRSQYPDLHDDLEAFVRMPSLYGLVGLRY